MYTCNLAFTCVSLLSEKKSGRTTGANQDGDKTHGGGRSGAGEKGGGLGGGDFLIR